MPALRPIHIQTPDPSSPSLAHILVPTFGLEEAYDWRKEFGRPGPIRLEIGPGKGLWLTKVAGADPDSCWIGVEYLEKRARWIAQKVSRAGLTNVRVIWHEAREALSELFAPGSVDAITVNFPDPWPKRRHRRRRLIQPPFCALMARALRPGGETLLVTDVLDYAREMVDFMDATPGLQNVLGPGGYAPDLQGYIPSIHYEKFAAAGRRFAFIRHSKAR
ncbi:MAG: tRNA (guanosine(46)-N7)-methyltransferase TrmB [Candidatus Riflebacteria bacterium]|nr:tRNA (guanosine(46)-N7)-methyltransferase TrmB [Candidatus Riflebacteria bacterium]